MAGSAAACMADSCSHRSACVNPWKKNPVVSRVPWSGIFLGGAAAAAYDSGVMTRSSIELAVQIFLVSLVVVFSLAFYKLMVLIGWW